VRPGSPLLPLLALAVFVSACSTPSSCPQGHFERGVRLYGEDNFEGAAREYRLAIEDDPMDIRAHFNLAVTLEEMKRPDLAREEYAWILSVRPEDLRASVNLAAMEIESGQREIGYSRLEGVVARYPTLAMPRVALATHYYREDRMEEAENLVRDGLAKDPSDIEGNFLLGTILVAKAERLDAGDPARAGILIDARKHFELALKNAPNDIPSLLALGRLARLEGRSARARDYFRRVTLHKRSSLEAHLALADLAEENGELEEAAYQLWQVRKIDPKRTEEVSSRLARIYDALRRQEEIPAPATRPESEQP
jgi:Tfp pilus assembly protein PilF